MRQLLWLAGYVMTNGAIGPYSIVFEDKVIRMGTTTMRIRCQASA